MTRSGIRLPLARSRLRIRPLVAPGSRLPSAVDEDDDGDRYKITCAEYHHARARALCAEGDIDGARARVRKASELWPPIRLEILDDGALAGIW